MTYSRKKISINSIFLDHENARHGSILDQKSIYEWMTTGDIGQKVLKLAREIASRGLSPLETPGVFKNEEIGKWVVLEGNRRVAALKFLNNPKLCPDKKLRAQYEKIKAAASVEVTTKAEFVVFKDIDDASYWIELRHGGEAGGGGIISWGAFEFDNFALRLGKKTQNSAAAQVLKYAMSKGILNQEQILSFPITTLSRLLSNPELREAIGCTQSRGETFIISDEPYFDRALTVLLGSLSSGVIKVTDVKSKAQRIGLAEKLKTKNGWEDYEAQAPRPLNPNRVDEPHNNEPGADNQPDSGETEEPSSERTQTFRGKHTAHRDKVFNRRTVNLDIPAEKKKAKSIVAELLILKHSGKNSTPISVAFLLRALIEISTDHYLNRHPQVRPKDANSLRIKVQACARHMQSMGVLSSDQLEAVISHCQQSGDMINITTLQKYLHDDTRFPTGEVINQLWDELGVYVTNCWLSAP